MLDEVQSRHALYTLSLLAGIEIPPEDEEALARALREQLATMTNFERLDLSDVDPILVLDLGW